MSIIHRKWIEKFHPFVKLSPILEIVDPRNQGLMVLNGNHYRFLVEIDVRFPVTGEKRNNKKNHQKPIHGIPCKYNIFIKKFK